MLYVGYDGGVVRKGSENVVVKGEICVTRRIQSKEDQGLVRFGSREQSKGSRQA